VAVRLEGWKGRVERGVKIGRLSGESREKFVHASGSSGVGATTASCGCSTGEGVKRFIKSDEKPARTVCCWTGSVLGRLMMKTNLVEFQAVVGRVEGVDETY
jgi:hypothetical protein